MKMIYERLGNQAAHGLAKFALDHPNLVWIEEIPPCISSCIIADVLPTSD